MKTTTIIVVPVDCSGHNCDLPGWDWLWLLLSFGGGCLALFIIAVLWMYFTD